MLKKAPTLPSLALAVAALFGAVDNANAQEQVVNL